MVNDFAKVTLTVVWDEDPLPFSVLSHRDGSDYPPTTLARFMYGTHANDYAEHYAATLLTALSHEVAVERLPL